MLVLLFTLPAVALPPRGHSSDKALGIVNDVFIDANRVLMFVTNHGNFGRDLAGVFGNDYGTNPSCRKCRKRPYWIGKIASILASPARTY